jgi:protein-S-isoprenylcysteine O-methyltransferase Ste14
MERFFDYYLLSALGCFFALVGTHAIVMRKRGVEFSGVSCPKSFGERAEDVLCTVVPSVRYYETVAYAWPLRFHIGPPVMGKVLISAIPVKILGAILWAAALVLCGSAHWAFGTSWRIRVGSDAPGKLIIKGPFAYSRNPVYLSFVLMTTGTFLLLGQFIFLLLALISIPLLHRRILREERFLSGIHGNNYQEYLSRVRRYL